VDPSLFAGDLVHVDLDSLSAIALSPWDHYSTIDTSWTPFINTNVVWKRVDHATFRKKDKGLHWYRIDVQLSGTQDPLDMLAVRMYNLSIAWELYWDGRVVARNGSPGINKKTEIPGKVYRLIRIPVELTNPGGHQIVLKTSSNRWMNLALPYASILGYTAFLQNVSFNTLFRAIGTGSIYLIAMLICFVLYLGGVENRPLLYFGFYESISFLFNLYVYLVHTETIIITQYNWIESSWYFILSLRYVLLFLFITENLEIRVKVIYPLILSLFLIVVSALLVIWNYTIIMYFCRVLLLAAFVVVQLIHLKRKVPGSRLVLAAVVVGTITELNVLIWLLGDMYYNIFIWLISLALRIIFAVFIVSAIIIRVSKQFQHFQVISLQTRRLEKKLEEYKHKTEYLVYRERNENHLISVHKIRFFKADRYIIEMHIQQSETQLVEKPLNQLESILPNHFLRIHRSYIVNLNFVESYRYTSGGMYEIQLKDGNVLPVSRSRTKELKDLLKK